MKSVILDRQWVKNVFITADTQADALIALYKAVFPEWDDIAQINGWPICHKATWEFICREFQNFDNRITNARRRNEGKIDVMPGGLWLNNGFSCNDDKANNLQFLEIMPCAVILKN